LQPSEIDRPVRATWLTHCVLPLLAAGLLSAMPLVVVALPAAIYLLMWMPGRSVLRILGLEHVRGRAILSVAISLVIVPIVLNLVWQHSNSRWVVLGVLVGLNLVLGLAAVRQPTTPAEPLPREGRFALAMILAWTCGLVFLFFWLPTAFDRFAKCPSFDYIKHHAMLYALDRSTLPLINVFYAAERDTPYYYYHYSYLIPASLRIVTGGSISIATAFALSSATIVGMVITIVYLLSLRFWDSPRAAILSALTASIVGGWDIVPAVIRYVLKGIPLVVLDAWCPVIWRLHSLVDNYIWCPQHIAGIMALLLACYLLTVGGLRWWWVPAAPLLGAYLFGTSIYEAMTTFAAVGVFVLTLLVSRDTAGRRGRLLAALAVIALLGGALMLPQARGYLEMAERYPRGLTASWPRMPFAVFGWLVPPGPLANWLDAPWLLLIEFALPFLAGVFVTGAVWRRFWSDPAQRLLMLSGLAAVLAAYTWRSSVSEIDYGFRTGVMAANAFGAILCGAMGAAARAAGAGGGAAARGAGRTR
jgi:hypothetical protein